MKALSKKTCRIVAVLAAVCLAVAGFVLWSGCAAGKDAVDLLLGKADHDRGRQCDPDSDLRQHRKILRLEKADSPQHDSQKYDGNIAEGLH